MNFFVEALREHIRTRELTQTQLAEYLGVDPPYISRWLRGASPRLDHLTQVLGKLGWDFERAKPNYDPASDALVLLREELQVRAGADPTPVNTSDANVVDITCDDGEFDNLTQMIEELLALRRATRGRLPVLVGQLNPPESVDFSTVPKDVDMLFLAALELRRLGSETALGALVTPGNQPNEHLYTVIESVEDASTLESGMRVVVLDESAGTHHLRYLSRMRGTEGLVAIPPRGVGDCFQLGGNGSRVTHRVVDCWRHVPVEEAPLHGR